MHIWLIKDSEILPSDGDNVRLLRMGILAKELVRRRHHVVWWISTFDHFKKQFRANEDKNINVEPNYFIHLLHACGYKKNISFKRIAHNHMVAKKFLVKAQSEVPPDVILAAMPTVDFAYVATKYAQEHNIPVFLDLRDMWPDIMVEAVPKVLRPLARLMLRWQFNKIKKACHSATGLIGITNSFLQWGLNYASRKPNQFDAIYPLAYSDRQPDAKMIEEVKLFWKQFGLVVDHNDFIVTYVGSLNFTYKIDLLIKVVKNIGKSIKLIICGDGSLLNSYKKQAEGCSNIIFTGWVDRPKIWYLLRLSNVGVSPHNERADSRLLLTNKIAEYLSAGLPVITNLPSDGETGRLLLDNNCGFCFSGDDPNNLTKILINVKDNPGLLKQMSKNALALYEEKFVAEKVYSDMADHLEKSAKKV